MTIAPQMRLAKDLEALDRDEAQNRRSRVDARREPIHRLVDRALEAKLDDGEQIDRLSDAVRERLEDGDADAFGDLLRRPIGEVVALIRADVGLEPDWEDLGLEPPPHPSHSGVQPPHEDEGESGPLSPWRSGPTPAGPCAPVPDAPAIPRPGWPEGPRPGTPRP